MSEAPAPAPPEPPPPAPRRATGRLAAGLLLCAAGIVWLLAAVDAFDVEPAVWLAALLILAGAVLVALPRGPHVPALVAVGIVLSLAGAAASTIDADLLTGGVGDRDERPASVSELERYELAIGSLRLDLTDLADEGPLDVRASVGVGELVVTVPADAELVVDASLGAGNVVVRGEERNGIDVDLSDRFPGPGEEIRLELDGGLGSIRVRDGV